MMDKNITTVEVKQKGPPPRMTRAQVDEAIRSLRRLPKNPNAIALCSKKEVLALLKPIVVELNTKKLYNVKEIAALIKERMTYIISVKELSALIGEEDPKKTVTAEEETPEVICSAPKENEPEANGDLEAGSENETTGESSECGDGATATEYTSNESEASSPELPECGETPTESAEHNGEHHQPEMSLCPVYPCN